MTFEQAVEHILDFEGGYVNDPLDPGGESNFGISKRTYPDLDIKNLSRVDAMGFYRVDFWNRLKIDMMPERLRLPFFDCAVNQGPGVATLWLQRIVGVKPDGIIGFVTLAQLNVSDIEKVRKEFFIRRMRGYTEAKGWPHFGAGWAMRLLKVALL
jgi:lysozyme family protein